MKNEIFEEKKYYGVYDDVIIFVKICVGMDEDVNRFPTHNRGVTLFVEAQLLVRHCR